MLESCRSSPTKISLARAALAKRRDLRHQFRVDHGGFVDHEDGAAVPCRAAVLDGEQLAMDRRGAGEAVARHVLGDGVGRRKADDPVAFRFIGLADRGHRIALAGAGLAVDDREALGAGGVTNSARLLARDSVKFLRAENLRADDAADHVRPCP